jgi:hypothetical protein
MSAAVLRRAREQRGGNSQPTPMSGVSPGMRPNTSIRGMQPQQPIQPRTMQSEGRQPPSRNPQPQPPIRPQTQREYTYQEPSPPQSTTYLPFNKLTIPDAIGLITLRLGRVEQFMIEMEENGNESNLPNKKLEELNQRITLLENTTPQNSSTEVFDMQISKIQESVDESYKNINKEMLQIKQNELKHKEDIFKLTRSFTEMGDSIKGLIARYDIIIQEINDKMNDFEYAFSEIEKQLSQHTIGMEEENTLTLPEIYKDSEFVESPAEEKENSGEEIPVDKIVITKEDLTDIIID